MWRMMVVDTDYWLGGIVSDQLTGTLTWEFLAVGGVGQAEKSWSVERDSIAQVEMD